MKKLLFTFAFIATLAFLAPTVSHAQATNHFPNYPAVAISSNPPSNTQANFGTPIPVANPFIALNKVLFWYFMGKIHIWYL